jgi:tRNA/tmRNA/rRNA uracil-C5-methylase (TrmA/RlmC/RlmD family)
LKYLADLDCGYGILTFIIAEFIDIKRTYAIDINKDRLEFLKNVAHRSSIDVITLQQDFCKESRRFYTLAKKFKEVNYIAK